MLEEPISIRLLLFSLRLNAVEHFLGYARELTPITQEQIWHSNVAFGFDRQLMLHRGNGRRDVDAIQEISISP